MKPKLEKELKRMVDLDMIEPIQKPTDWVNGLVVVERPNGKLRVCLDPRPLKKVIKCEHLNLPTAGETFSSGIYRFKRWSYGIYSAGDIFSKEVTLIISTYRVVQIPKMTL